MNQQIEWSDPPPKKTMLDKEFVQELMKRPKTWAVYKHSAKYQRGSQFQRYYPGVKVTYRNVGKNEKGVNMYMIWAMWDPNIEVDYNEPFK
jgi:hypothetical protein